ncbi:MAG: sigma-70 family RNA polymerase sigma factor [Frisingicoccus sp.]|uniref:RNA polymerase sigma factor n=1 Tax=Frisingicoccus sp. TaxID=1918627 RepID=UPI002637F461|nr:sigma-70 family RNA polymerase sigma factor [Frisingicoccus sp.]MDD6231562.1 sigma-70 family RNA polymerase sigma factor [Frisingicoccus sp.]
MDRSELYAEILNASRGNKDAIEHLIIRFMPLIKKNSAILNYDGADSDLIIFFIEKLYTLDTENLSRYSDSQLIMFYKTLFRNKAIDINRQRKKILECTENFEQDTIEIGYEDNPSFIFYDLIKDLSPKQQDVIKLKFMIGLSDVEIGQVMGITRQAVNRLYNRAILALRKSSGVISS